MEKLTVEELKGRLFDIDQNIKYLQNEYQKGMQILQEKLQKETKEKVKKEK